MLEYAQSSIAEAFNSMLRTDYISLNDIDKLSLLSTYYVDHFGLLPEILSDTDQLIVGRRGTGKTTLLYRALVGCMESWKKDYPVGLLPRERTLGIYVDLSKCQYIDDIADTDFSAFEHAFVSEVCDAINDQLTRFWPALSQQPSYFSKLFRAAEANRVAEVRKILDRIAQLLKEGLPRVVDRSEAVREKETSSVTASSLTELSASFKSEEVSTGAKLNDGAQEFSGSERSYSTRTSYRLTIADVLRILGELREKAGLSATYLLIDEFSDCLPNCSVAFQRC